MTKLIQDTVVAEREELAFDDMSSGDNISTDVTFGAIFSAWFKQAVRNSPVEVGLEKLVVMWSKAKQQLRAWRDDLKWAMQADLDEPVQQVKKPQAEHPASLHKTVDININLGTLPKISLPASSAQTFMRKRKKLLAFVACLALIVIYTVLGSLHLQQQSQVANHAGGTSSKVISRPTATPSAFSTTTATKTTNTPPDNPAIASGSGIHAPGTSAEQPTFRGLIPTGKTITDVGGWQPINSPDSMSMVAYTDVFRGAKISVGQQLIPGEFNPNVDDKVASLAETNGATNIYPSGVLTIFTSPLVQGKQTVVFTKNNILVFIKSDQKLDDSAWGWYADNLN